MRVEQFKNELKELVSENELEGFFNHVELHIIDNSILFDKFLQQKNRFNRISESSQSGSVSSDELNLEFNRIIKNIIELTNKINKQDIKDAQKTPFSLINFHGNKLAYSIIALLIIIIGYSIYVKTIDPSSIPEKELRLSELKPIEELAVSENVFWLGTKEGFWIYENGQLINENKTVVIDSNYLVYNPFTDKSYYLRNAVNIIDSVPRSAIVIETNDHIFWYGDESNFNLFDKGEELFDLSTTYDGPDLVVYRKETEKKYRLKNGRFFVDQKLRIGKYAK